METACLYPSDRDEHGGRKVTEISVVTEVLLLKRKIYYSRALRH